MKKNLIQESGLATAFGRTITTYITEVFGGKETAYSGRCWISASSFDQLFSGLGKCQSIRCWSGSDPETSVQLLEHPFRSIVPFPMFSTWQRVQGCRLQLTGTIVLDLWVTAPRTLNIAVAVSNSSMTVSAGDILPGLLETFPYQDELVQLFRVPIECGKTLMLLKIDGGVYSYDRVAHNAAERKLLQALRGATGQPLEISEELEKT